MIKAVYRVLIPNSNHNDAWSYPLHLLSGPHRGPVARGIRANINALEYRFLEVLGFVGKDEDMLRTNSGSYTSYVKKMLQGHIMIPKLADTLGYQLLTCLAQNRHRSCPIKPRARRILR